MARCEHCEKVTRFGRNKPHSLKRTNRTFKPNLQKTKVLENGRLVSKVLCTKCIKSMAKMDA
jgi:large subunit ribosomal protein L28